MKSKILPVALLVIFLFVILVIGRPLIFPNQEAKGLNPEKEKGLTVIYEPDEFSEAGLKEVGKFISDKQKELSSLSTKTIKDRNAEKIGEFYGDGSALTTHEGKSVKGKQAIIKYFKDHSSNITNLEFKLEFVYAKEFTHILNLKDKRSKEERDRDIIHVVYLIISSSFDFNGERIDPPSGSNWRHIRECEWVEDI